MSLLMEALRKAEEAKRRVQNPDVDEASILSSESANQPETSPVPVPTPLLDTDLAPAVEEHDLTADYIAENFLRDSKKTTLDDPALSAASASNSLSGRPSRASVEELQNYLATAPELEDTTPVLRTTTPAKPSAAVQRRTAGAVFAAKQKPVASRTTRNGLFALAVVIVVIFGGGFWYITNQGNSSLMTDPALLSANMRNRSLSDEQLNVAPPTQPEASISSQAITSADRGENVTVDVQGPILGTTTERQSQGSTDDPTSDANTVTESPAAASPIQASAGAPQTSVAESTATLAVAGGSTLDAITRGASTVLEISHSKRATNSNQQLLNAYAMLQAGNIGAASTLYKQVLEQLPNNRDALLGSAAIALREGNIAEGRVFYSRLMQLNPRDPLARTGLLQTVQDIDPVQYEQELLRLLQQFPEVAPLSFALGNSYAAQRRWNEAQTAYFNALLFARRSNETLISPDYAYNLAISLEQINQPAAALDYYRQAQTLARDVTPGFDMQTLSRRILSLERARP